MNRVDRLNAILIQLQSKKIVRAQEIADRFEISLRTVYRDIRALEEAGVPIGAEAGVGYFLTEGYHLPPIMFTKEEASAILLAGKILEKIVDVAVNQQFNNAVLKIKAVLDPEKKDSLENLENKISIDPFQLQFFQKPEISFLNEIQQALWNNKVLAIRYFTNYNQSECEREIEPIGICYYSSNWHVIGWCRKRKDYRDFRVDRILELEIKNETFVRAKRQSLQAYLDKLYQSTELKPVTIRVDKTIARYINQAKLNFGWVKEEELDETIEMHFATYSLEYFGRWMLMFGKHVEIVEPQELKTKILYFVEELGHYYLTGKKD